MGLKYYKPNKPLTFVPFISQKLGSVYTMNIYKAKNPRLIEVVERYRRSLFLGSKFIAIFSSIYFFELGLAAEYFLSFMFFVNTVSVSLGSDFLLKEFGKRISSIDLLRVKDDAVAYSIQI